MRITRFWENVKYEAGRVWAALRRPIDRFAERRPDLAHALVLALVAEMIAAYGVMLYALTVTR